MNQIVKKFLAAMAVSLLISTPTALAENLVAAWGEALAGDQTIQAMQSRVASAEAEFEAAKAARLPKVSASAGITQFDDAPAFDFSGAGVPAILPLFDGESMRMADARITLPLFTGGRVMHGIDAAEAMLEVQQFQSGASTQQIKLAVAEQYINVLRAKSALAVANSNVKSLSAHVRDVDSMFKSGAVARNDYLAAAVSLADSEQRRLQSRNGLDLANAAYNRALGRDLGAPVSLDENLPGIDPGLDLTSLEALTDTALQSRAELGRLESAAKALRYRADSMRAETRPHIAVTGGYIALQNEFLNRDEFWMVGVGVQWNFFDGGQARRKASALSLKSNAIRHERNDLRSLIELQVRQSWLRLNETYERRRLTARAVEQAEENLRVVRDRYRNGEGTNTEVLDAEMLRSLSRSNHDNADFDAKLALYELARGVGRL